VRVTFAHPTSPPAVALTTITVGAAAPGQTGTTTTPTQFSPVFRLRGTARQGISLRALRARGLPLAINVGTARTVRFVVRRGTSTVGSTRQHVHAGLANVRWRPSASLTRKLRAGRSYGLRVRVRGLPTLQLTFRVR
jgi:hypothetical protein